MSRYENHRLELQRIVNNNFGGDVRRVLMHGAGVQAEMKDRYKNLYTALCSFVNENKTRVGVGVVVNKSLLWQSIIDYTVDIRRLKDFHVGIDHENERKVRSYLMFWFLRHKPIQVTGETCPTLPCRP